MVAEELHGAGKMRSSSRLLSGDTADTDRGRVADLSFHYLLGADWRLCTRRLKIDRGTFFHAVYRLQAQLGAGFS